MNAGVLLFVTYGANLVAQWLDGNLTSLGLANKLEEGNPITSAMMKKFGLAGTNFIKMGAVPFGLMAAGMISHHPQIGIVGNTGMAIATLPVIVKNILLLKKNKIKISLF